MDERAAADPAGLRGGALGRFLRWLAAPPARPGRLDRVDLVVVAFLVLAVGGSRLWRLEEPRAMHFDEVYHARTAAEFLQAWRYGIPHDIYEFTHPHLAKYAMAAGMTLAAGPSSQSVESPGGPVASALVVPAQGAVGLGARLVLALPGALVVRDGADDAELARLPIAGVRALALIDRRLLMGTVGGELLSGDIDELIGSGGDGSVPGSPDEAAPLTRLARLEGPVRAILPAPSGASLLVLAGDELIALSTSDGREGGRSRLSASGPLAPAGTLRVLTVEAGAIKDTDAFMTTLASELPTIPTAGLRERLAGGGAVALGLAEATSSADPALAGASQTEREVAAVGTADGISFVDAASALVLAELPTAAPIAGLALATDGSNPRLYGTAGSELFWLAPAAGESSFAPSIGAALSPGGALGAIAVDQVSSFIHVAGADRGGRARLFTVEPRGFSVFTDVPAADPAPTALLADVNTTDRGADRARLLALGSAGALESFGIGRIAFGWRLPGVLASLLMLVALYALARVLFRRRSVAVLAGLLAGLDGLLFVSSRIGMNDPYVGAFILVAYALFARLWIDPRPGWRSLAGSGLAIGLALGLALASKWVALYAIGALGLLVLGRSGGGRLLALAGLTALVGVLGYRGLEAGGGGPPFLAIGIALVALAALLAGRAPGSRDEEGAEAALERAWPGRGLPITLAWSLLFLGLVPLAVYVLSYLPWAALGNQLWTGFPAGHDGQTLLDLTRSMYDYHDGLREGHPASSPWWAWPLDLKPVWFHSASLAGGLTESIFDGPSPVLRWGGLVALAWAALAAWRRHSLALGLLLVGFAAAWLPWARIDRATFGYHFYTALPFALLALAALLSEAWAARERAPVAARLAVGILAPFPALLWIARPALCALAGVATANPGGSACAGSEGIPPELIAAVAFLPLLVIGRELAGLPARRLVAAFLAIAGLWALVWYPNLAALGVPDELTRAYRALLPSYSYDFWFAVSTAPKGEAAGLASPAFALLAASIVSTALTLVALGRSLRPAGAGASAPAFVEEPAEPDQGAPDSPRREEAAP